MGMSTKVVLLRDENDKDYQNHLKIFNAYEETGMKLPNDIAKYFTESYIDHDNCYAKDCDPQYPLTIIDFKATRFNNEVSEGIEIKLKDLPKGVSTIRFVNSW